MLSIVLLNYYPGLVESAAAKQADASGSAKSSSAERVRENETAHDEPLKQRASESDGASRRQSKQPEAEQSAPPATAPTAEASAPAQSDSTTDKPNAGDNRENTAASLQAKAAAPKSQYYDVPITYTVTGHEDGSVRFWDEAGRLLKTVLIPTRIRGTPIIQLCTDNQLQHLFVADTSKYTGDMVYI